MRNLEDCLQIAALTDVGCVRANNEDAVGQDPALGVAVLCDGVGGHKAGEVASGMAVGIILSELAVLRDLPPAPPAGAVARETALAEAAIHKANAAIHRTAARQANYRGMGTTVALAVFYGSQATLAHVGDSRIYRLRGDRFERMTRDHSLVAELLEKGYFKTPEEAAEAHIDNVITRSLGVEEDVQVDIREEATEPGDVYLLCSDGLSDLVPDPELAAVIERHAGQPDRAVAELVELAKRNGGKDNISAILIRLLRPCPTGNGRDIPRPWHRKIRDWFTQHLR
jgi:serine/threonine protein phosphatase PrpC